MTYTVLIEQAAMPLKSPELINQNEGLFYISVGEIKVMRAIK